MVACGCCPDGIHVGDSDYGPYRGRKALRKYERTMARMKSRGTWDKHKEAVKREYQAS